MRSLHREPPYLRVQSLRARGQPVRERCAICTLEERDTTLLADDTGRVHPQLQPLYDVLLRARRPQTVLYWFNRRSGGPEILKAMAEGQVDISHQAFEQLPSNKAVNYIRDLLVTTGVLPAYHGPIERITPWLAGVLGELSQPDADVVRRFARWEVLRRLRQHAQAGTLTQGAISRDRATIVVTVRFLTWLRQNNLDLTGLGQTDMDRYSAEHPSRAESLAVFLAWARRSAVTKALEVPIRQPPLPMVTLSDAQRWAEVDILLHDHTIALNARVAGLFTLLFAQPLARICQMTADQVHEQPEGHLTVTFDTVPVELPEPLDRLVLAQVAAPGQASYPPGDQRWLFPGAVPGRHLSTGVIRSKLVARGIHPAQSRKAAMFQLAANIPPRSSPNSSGWEPTPPSDGRPSQRVTAPNTPPPGDPDRRGSSSRRPLRTWHERNTAHHRRLYRRCTSDRQRQRHRLRTSP